jgi:D-sedoheptulose 7-phosphate isomerase
MTNQRILSHFHESAEIKIQSATVLAQPIAQAVELMFSALSNGNKILACGNGGSAADAQHFAAELVGRFERERFPLPAISLATTATARFSPSRCRRTARLATSCWRFPRRAIRPT